MNGQMLAPSAGIEMGKCGEYYAVFSLIKQGYVCFLSDQGLPYDIVVDVGGRLLKGQVKCTWSSADYGKSKKVFRFGTRSGKGAMRSTSAVSCDFYAFVAINEEKIAFLSTCELLSLKNEGSVKQTIEFRSDENEYPGRTYSTGRVRKLDYHRCIESFSDFKRVLNIKDKK